MSVIEGRGFFGEYGRKVLLGNALEWLFQAAATDALGPTWEVIHWFSEDLGPNSCRDVFDFFLAERANGEVRRSILVQVTHYPESAAVEEEPNKTYEALETFEEFAYIESLALQGRTRFVTPDTALVHVLFGNKGRIRQWAITLFEGFLDRCMYPQYSGGQLDGTQSYRDLNVIANDIKSLVENGRLTHGREFTHLQELKASGKLPDSIRRRYDRIEADLRNYVSIGCPRNQVALELWRARSSYQNTQEYHESLARVTASWNERRPSSRQSVKKSAVAGSAVPPGTNDVSAVDLAEVIRINQRKNPFNQVSLAFMADYASRYAGIANQMGRDKAGTISNLWSTPGIGERNFYRPFLFAISGLRVDDFTSLEGVTEQTIYLSDLPRPSTRVLLERIYNALPSGREAVLRFLLTKKKVVEDLVRNKVWNGTNVDPVSDYLGMLLDREVRERRIQRLERTREAPTFLTDWLQNREVELVTYPHHKSGEGD